MLANEQVIDGCCWRHEDTQVEPKKIEQWFLRITQYADELLEALSQLEGGWPERVLTMQRNWIGKSRGTRVRFAVEEFPDTSIEVFTTRVDTIYGASAIILAPEHPFIDKFCCWRDAKTVIADKAANLEALAKMRQQTTRAADIATAEKIGFFTGFHAREPV